MKNMKKNFQPLKREPRGIQGDKNQDFTGLLNMEIGNAV